MHQSHSAERDMCVGVAAATNVYQVAQHTAVSLPTYFLYTYCTCVPKELIIFATLPERLLSTAGPVKIRLYVDLHLVNCDFAGLAELEM